MSRGTPARSFALRVAVTLALFPAGAIAQPSAVDGIFISVHSPITGEERARVMAITHTAIERFRTSQAAPEGKDGRERTFKLIYDFTPKGGRVNTPDFSACDGLADDLALLNNVMTVAFIHGEVSRHTVLPILACKEIVFSEKATLGPVQGDGEGPPKGKVRSAYEEICKARGRCPAVVLKLLDRDMELLEAQNAKGEPWWIDARRQAEEARERVVVTDQKPVIGKGPVSYTAAQAQKFGLCQEIRESREDVRVLYRLPPTSLRDVPLWEGKPIAYRIRVQGPVNRALEESLRRRITKAVARHANIIILELECNGGDTMAAIDLAEYLRDRKDDSGLGHVLTVAYVPHRAPDTATIIALGCSEIAMAKEAEIGDFSAFVPEGQPAADNTTMRTLMELAKERSYNPLLIRGMFDRQVTIHEVVSRVGARQWALVTDEELKEDQKGVQRWGPPKQIKPGGPDGQLLVLNAPLAREVQLARHVIDVSPKDAAEDLSGLYAAYGLKREDVRDARNDWLDDVANFLRWPVVTMFLVILGFTCLILELKLPGASLPGVTAAVCFVLFFWAHSQLAGSMWWLAVLLFLLGLILLGVEIFVLPGFGLVGISGILLIVCSLALVTLERQPQTSDDWMQFFRNAGTFSLVLVAAVISAFVLVWYLPNIPYINRLILKPAGEGDGMETAPVLMSPEAAALLGAIGVAATPLRPAGKVKFGDDFVDVLAEGSYVEPGTRVQVVEIEGNRIVVKEV